MKAQDYILKKLDVLRQPEPLQDIAPDKLEEAILAKVLSKKFRKYKADTKAINICKRAIHHAVVNEQPVKIGPLFGGNKLWRFDEAPEPDWAELFNLIYIARWMKIIASVYEYGANFEYYSQDTSVERLNNLSRAETGQYTKTFRELLNWFSKHLPDRVTFSYVCHSEMFDDENEYDKELYEAKAKMLAKSGGKLPEMSEAQKRATELNVRLKPGQDDDPQWREKVELEHQAIFATRTLLPHLLDETMIHTSAGSFSGHIATGSTKYSIAKFWASVGVLQPDGGGYKDLALSPTQLGSAQFEWQNINLGISGKNFSKIRIIKVD
ncbi:hypothetical protein FWD20_03705 [Candidatus Saccharibacteria bacterium]|nr:hypothetical protein [Candidatus Saccharibacteria bacterium]